MTSPEQQADDLRILAQDPRVLRFVFAILESAGMWASTYGTDGRHLAYYEGRRSLGLEIVDWLKGPRPDVLLAIVREGTLATLETVDGNRRHHRNRNPDRDAELADVGDHDDDRGPADRFDGRRATEGRGAGFLDYSDNAAKG